MHFTLEGNQDMLVIVNRANGMDELITLIDTGANMPVWCADEKLLKLTFPGAYKVKDNATITGFGGKSSASLWIIPKFTLSDGKEQVVYPKLPIVICGLSRSFRMIMSFTMLDHAELSYKSIRQNNGFKRTLDISYEQKCVLTRHNGDYVTALTHSFDRKQRTVQELLTDNALFLKAGERNISMVNLYSVLPSIVKDTTDLTDKEILDKVETELIVNDF